MKKSNNPLKISIITIVTAIFLLIALSPIYFDKLTLDNYLKNYSSLILIFLTYIYVLLTYLILNSSKKLSQEQLRPYVIASFIEENNGIYFSVKNYGHRPAFKIDISLSDGFEEFQSKSLKGNYRYMLKQQFLAPSQEIKNYVTAPMYILSRERKNANKCFDFTVSFSDSDDIKYKLIYKIDFDNLFDEKSIQKVSIIDSLNDIKNELQNQNKLINGFLDKQG